MRTYVDLYEDNAGTLILVSDDLTWFNIPLSGTDGFLADARAILNDDTQDWNIDVIVQTKHVNLEHPELYRIAHFDGEHLEILHEPGSAAAEYLGQDR